MSMACEEIPVIASIAQILLGATSRPGLLVAIWTLLFWLLGAGM
ncbi:MAG: hypothetical protein SFZ24_05755 [Planctomycetota bacterium]|nr:hypothetical protein [Planctomycetota bacterium]